MNDKTKWENAHFEHDANPVDGSMYKPAAAQKAVAWFTWTHNKMSRRISEDREDLAQRAAKENAEMDQRGVSECYRIVGPFPLYAAPVAAAPGIDLQERLSRAYSERNALAIAFARAALAAGWPAGHGFDADATKDWDDDWRHVIYVDLPSGAQVSWHVSPDEIAILDGLPEYVGKWDGTFVAKNPSWCQFDASPKGGSTGVEPKIWGTQIPGSMPKLFGARHIAELNWYPDEGYDLVCMQVTERVQATSAEVGE